MTEAPAVPGDLPAIARGLSAFPLTPLHEECIDTAALEGMVVRAAEAGADSIGVLGSTGAYAYLDRAERRTALDSAVQAAGDVPVLAGIGAPRTAHVSAFAEDAQAAGAAGVMLAPVTYQMLTDDEIVGLYRDVCAELSVPLVVYDNPATTHVRMTHELYGRLAELPGVAALKIRPVPSEAEAARVRVHGVRAVIPAHVGIGVSGDAVGARGVLAGCDAWYSALAGVLPEVVVPLHRAAAAGDELAVRRAGVQLAGLWTLFEEHGGSLRVLAAVAEERGLVRGPCLPRPLQGLGEEPRQRLRAVLEGLGLEVVGS